MVKLSTLPFSANRKLHFFITISDAPFVYTLEDVYLVEQSLLFRVSYLNPPVSRGMMVLMDLRAELNV